MLDCHFHSEHSCDGDAPLTAMCQRALELGLSYICPTEHVDFDPQDVCYGYYDDTTYSRAVNVCRGRFDGRLTLLKGVEIDYQPCFEAQVRAFLTQHTFDFVVGSVHYVDGLHVGKAPLQDYDPDAVCRHYFAAVQQAAASGLFDVIGHLDLLKRYGVSHWGAFDAHRYAKEIDAVLQAAVERGTGLEINTSGLRQAPAETFPGLETLRRYRELGGETITLGSDAHRAADLGKDIDQGLALARAAGFEAIAVFVERQPHRLDIQPPPPVGSAPGLPASPGKR